MERVTRSEAEWRDALSPERYHVLREAGTEPRFSGDLLDNKRPGRYVCAGCGNPLFHSDSKYDSGSGWPSFYETIHPDAVTRRSDTSYGYERTEVRCAACDGHLGHVFDDGPAPTGERYCMNSLALRFEEER